MTKNIKTEMSRKMKSKCANCGKAGCHCGGPNGTRNNPPTKTTGYVNPKE